MFMLSKYISNYISDYEYLKFRIISIDTSYLEALAYGVIPFKRVISYSEVLKKITFYLPNRGEEDYKEDNTEQHFTLSVGLNPEPFAIINSEAPDRKDLDTIENFLLSLFAKHNLTPESSGLTNWRSRKFIVFIGDNALQAINVLLKNKLLNRPVGSDIPTWDSNYNQDYDEALVNRSKWKTLMFLKRLVSLYDQDNARMQSWLHRNIKNYVESFYTPLVSEIIEHLQKISEKIKETNSPSYHKDEIDFIEVTLKYFKNFVDANPNLFVYDPFTLLLGYIQNMRVTDIFCNLNFEELRKHHENSLKWYELTKRQQAAVVERVKVGQDPFTEDISDEKGWEHDPSLPSRYSPSFAVANYLRWEDLTISQREQCGSFAYLFGILQWAELTEKKECHDAFLRYEKYYEKHYVFVEMITWAVIALVSTPLREQADIIKYLLLYVLPENFVISYPIIDDGQANIRSTFNSIEYPKYSNPSMKQRQNVVDKLVNAGTAMFTNYQNRKTKCLSDATNAPGAKVN